MSEQKFADSFDLTFRKMLAKMVSLYNKLTKEDRAGGKTECRQQLKIQVHFTIFMKQNVSQKKLKQYYMKIIRLVKV